MGRCATKPRHYSSSVSSKHLRNRLSCRGGQREQVGPESVSVFRAKLVFQATNGVALLDVRSSEVILVFVCLNVKK